MGRPKIVQSTVEPTLTDVINLIRSVAYDVGFIKSDLAEVKTDLGNFKKETRGKFEDLNKNMQGMNKEISALTRRMTSMDTRVSGLSSRVGSVHERSFRQGLEDRFGKRYIRSFDATNLLGIARLVAMKSEYRFLNTDPLDQIDNAKKIAATITHDQVDKLYRAIDTILQFIEREHLLKIPADIRNTRKEYINDMLSRVSSSEKKYSYHLLQEIHRLLENENPDDYYVSSFGFAAYVCQFFPEVDLQTVKENHGYQTNLELDCRGMVIKSLNGFIYDFAEIKSGDTEGLINKGVEQIMLSAKIAEKALKAIHPNASIEIIGRLFLNSREHRDNISSENIQILFERE